MWVADVVVQREQPALGLEHDGEGRELLGGRADVGARVGGERDAVGEVGHAVGLRVERLPVAPDLYRRPRRVLSIVAGHELVGELLRVGLDRLQTQKRDGVVAGFALVRGQLDGVGAGFRRTRGEALGAPARSGRVAEAFSVRGEQANVDVG